MARTEVRPARETLGERRGERDAWVFVGGGESRVCFRVRKSWELSWVSLFRGDRVRGKGKEENGLKERAMGRVKWVMGRVGWVGLDY